MTSVCRRKLPRSWYHGDRWLISFRVRWRCGWARQAIFTDITSFEEVTD